MNTASSDVESINPTVSNNIEQPLNVSPTFRSALDLKLTRLQRDVLRMGALVESSCLLAREALCDRNIDAAKNLKKHDKQVDYLYRQIEVDCINLITLESPVTRDVRLVSALMQMIRDLERIGDYAKDIGEVSLKLFPYPPHDAIEQIQVMLDRCRSMVALSLLSLSELDVDAGREIKEKDDVVDDDYERLFDLLVQSPTAASNVEPTVLLVLVIRYLERIADHATNIGRRVVFVVTGERH
ncbi:phosphate transport system regulatory protein PhoU [Leptolyngbyaceae cyanobacterium CCMR0082]|uniref:Phosphate-specific transport system accessory protein PhoU n=2 Tax=Adonisia turfae TaxID=2950184 RepID=A0A6M0S6Q0_9CYAN|nr:phosphate signaling complex protein PhoU [Adonisia turfae]MDV3348788.1 phosphate signaling complex protein PhoU [Leptothoe sp. LEGE 181152]NEZ56541.1 phosphate transport system regulatory protein PhoU [Adonisia turfae CCMR0081]NEZ64115.1 phosphate transport system regulatory protein PhoU [Adonisia turfae CCMR0082]